MKSSLPIALAAALFATAVSAADSAAAPKKNPDEPIATSPDASAETTAGTTIVGDQEAPIGLYITPWKDEFAERGLDRPARLLDEALQPIDPATFRRQIEYYQTITTYRRSQQRAAGTPNNP